jgi:hypothetical protein
MIKKIKKNEYEIRLSPFFYPEQAVLDALYDFRNFFSGRFSRGVLRVALKQGGALVIYEFLNYLFSKVKK